MRSPHGRQGTSLRRRLAVVGLSLLLGSLSGTAQNVGPAAPQVLGADSIPDVIVGPASGALPVRAYSGADGALLATTWPFGSSFTGGVRLAAGDVNGDGVTDVVAAMGPGGALVRVLSGVDGSEIVSGYPFGSTFTGGIEVAVADVDGDGRAEVIAGHGADGGEVRVVDGTDAQLRFGGPPFGPSYRGGVRVAAGDVTGDGQVDFIVAQATGGMVRIFSGADYAIVASGVPYGETFTGGVHIAAGDVDGDGRDEVIVGPGMGDGPVRIFDVVAQVERASFEPYWQGFPGGSRVAAADLNGDGRAEIITVPGPSAPPLLRVFDGVTLSHQASLLVYDSAFTGGVFVAAPAGRLRFTSASQATFVVGQAGHFAITTTGSSAPPTTLTLSGALPSGVTFTDNGGGTGTVVGIPDVGANGPYALTLTATTGVAAAVTQAFMLTVVSPPNTAPSFVRGADQFVNPNTGSQTVQPWATAITAGPPPDAGQTVSFVVAGNTNPALFTAAPVISTTGTLSYTPAPGAFGAATITTVLRDDGGTANGGVDVSSPQSFDITVLPCTGGTYSNDGALLNGAAYTIKFPDNWNGILIVYARPFELTKPSEANAFWPGLPAFMSSPSAQVQDFEAPLLAAGYALAGSTLRTGGWAVEEGGEDLTRLATIFSANHCVPTHTIVVGFDMGGLIALKSMEAGGGPFDGAIATCAPAAGMTKQADRALVQNLAIEATMAWPAPWGTPGDVRDDLTLADIEAVHYLAFQDDRSVPLYPAYDFVRLLLNVPENLYFDAPTPAGRTLVRYYTLVLADLERRHGGPVAQGARQPYSLSASDLAEINASIQLIELFGLQNACAPGDSEVCPLPVGITAEQFVADLNSIPPVMPDAAARTRLAATNDLTGLVTGPVITLHTTIDPLLPPSGTTSYLDAVTAAGRQQQLLRLFTDSRAGHCAFNPEHLLGVISAMRSWLETGVRPSVNDNTFFPAQEGFTRSFDPGRWPF